MRRRLINTMQAILPNKMLRRQQFTKRINNIKRHTRRYNIYTYRPSTKASSFSRWQDYKRILNRFY